MDIEIFPHRILSADTTERLLNDLEELEGIKRMVIQGQRLPQSKENSERRVITILGEEVDLQVQTGRVLMDVEDEEIIDDIKSICDDVLQFGYDVNVGKFIRTQKTVTDDMKYGEAVNDIPDEMFGLTDQNAQLSERATIIKKKD